MSTLSSHYEFMTPDTLPYLRLLLLDKEPHVHHAYKDVQKSGSRPGRRTRPLGSCPGLSFLVKSVSYILARKRYSDV